MITFGEFVIASTFCSAARQGWKEITGKSLAPDQNMGEVFWLVLQKELEQYKLEQTQAGIAFRAGRCGFHAFLDMTGVELGLRTAEFRLHPVKMRLEKGFALLIEVCQRSGLVHLTGAGDMSAGFCVQYGETVSTAQSGYLMGFFQEFFEWASQGKVFPLKQIDVNGFCFAPEPLNL